MAVLNVLPSTSGRQGTNGRTRHLTYGMGEGDVLERAPLLEHITVGYLDVRSTHN